MAMTPENGPGPEEMGIKKRERAKAVSEALDSTGARRFNESQSEEEREMQIEASKKFGEILKSKGAEKKVDLTDQEFTYLSQSLDNKLDRGEITPEEYKGQLRLLQNSTTIEGKDPDAKKIERYTPPSPKDVKGRTDEPIELTEDMVVKEPTKKTVVDKLKKTTQDKRQGKLKPETEESKAETLKLKEEMRRAKKRPEVEAEQKRLERKGLTDPAKIMENLKKRAEEERRKTIARGKEIKQEGRSMAKEASQERFRKKFEEEGVEETEPTEDQEETPEEPKKKGLWGRIKGLFGR